jgi:regulator of ribonuclease activity A
MSQAFATADLCDLHEARLRSCSLQFRQFGALTRFCGAIRTVKCYDDNILMRRTLETLGEGRVLVVDGAGYLGSALIGDQIALLAQQNGWAGVVIHGAVRDVVALAGIELGVKALGSNPRKSGKAGIGQMDVPVVLGGVTFHPGEWIYSDEDGLLVAAEGLPF